MFISTVKKQTFGKICTFFIIVILSLTSCKNFMSGGDFINQLQDEIEYSNAPVVTVRVQPAIANKGITYPNGDSSQKVGYSFSISYEPDENSIFSYWSCEDTNGNNAEEYVIFENKNAVQTQVTINQETAVIIKAVAYDKPKTTVSLACTKFSGIDSGTLSSTDTKTYDIGEKFNISFTENSGYQFVKWTVENNCVSIEDPFANPATVTTKENGNVKITALCVERPYVTNVSTKDTTKTYYKDVKNIIDFSKPISIENNFQKIKIYINDSPVLYSDSGYFCNPVLSNDKKTVSISANKNNMIEVDSGKTKSITVQIPSDLYYEYVDSETNKKIKIFIGGDGYSWSYKIDESTNDRLNIIINNDLNDEYGTLIKGNLGSNSSYIGSESTFSYNVKDTAQFIGWKFSEDITNSVDFEEYNNGSVYSIKIKAKQADDISIKPVAYIRPKTDSTFLIQPSNTQQGNNFNSDFKVKFTKKLDKDTLLKNAIIKSDNLILSGKEDEADLVFFTPEYDTTTNTFTFKAANTLEKILDFKNLVNFSGNTTKYLNVIIPSSSIYYTLEDGTKIFAAEDFQYTYKIVKSTEENIKIGFSFIEESGILRLMK